MHLRESDIGKGPDDAAFLLLLQRSISNDRGVYPPLAFTEIYRNDVSTKTRIRRLHLLVVDLERTKSVNDEVYWQYQKVQVSTDYPECFNTLPVPVADVESPVRCRCVYGHGVDASDRPSYLLWPRRGSDGHFWRMDPRSGKFFDPGIRFGAGWHNCVWQLSRWCSEHPWWISPSLLECAHCVHACSHGHWLRG